MQIYLYFFHRSLSELVYLDGLINNFVEASLTERQLGP